MRKELLILILVFVIGCTNNVLDNEPVSTETIEQPTITEPFCLSEADNFTVELILNYTDKIKADIDFIETKSEEILKKDFVIDGKRTFATSSPSIYFTITKIDDVIYYNESGHSFASNETKELTYDEFIEKFTPIASLQKAYNLTYQHCEYPNYIASIPYTNEQTGEQCYKDVKSSPYFCFNSDGLITSQGTGVGHSKKYFDINSIVFI